MRTLSGRARNCRLLYTAFTVVYFSSLIQHLARLWIASKYPYQAEPLALCSYMRGSTIFSFFSLLATVAATSDAKYKTILDSPRLHFIGRYIVNAATGNNFINNYNEDTFLPHHALPTDEGGTGGWNPSGTNDFFFKDVKINRVCYADGRCTDDERQDSAIGKHIQGILIVISLFSTLSARPVLQNPHKPTSLVWRKVLAKKTRKILLTVLRNP